MELETVKTNHHKFMGMEIFKILMVLIFASSPYCADGRTDEELVKIAYQTYEALRAETEQIRISAVRNSLEHLSDAERTRALALVTYDIAAKKFGGRIMNNAPSSVKIMLEDDPELISDPTELKRMIAAETDPKKFFILVSMANQLIISHKSDFVVEMTPMLFRHEPPTSTDPDSEYYTPGLSDVSFLAYGMITKNLKALNADFTPPDEKLPYEERIPVLVKWLKSNWPGCANLGENTAVAREMPEAKSEEGTSRPNKRPTSQPETSSSRSSGTNNPWWKIPAVAGVLLLICGLWFLVTSRRKSN